jgi:dihydropteroate synthase
MPLVMGIVNLSDDSFSGDGCSDVNSAWATARVHQSDGAQIIDVGAESARTDREPISEAEEIDRLCTFVARRNAEMHDNAAILSINTWRPAVARAVLHQGGEMLNDIGGLPTDDNARTCAESGAALVIMHTCGTPKVRHTHVRYEDVMADLDRHFSEKIAIATAAGLPRESIVLDPGIDFAKQQDDNLRIYRELSRLHRFERPILLPVSRKTVVGEVLGLPPPERDAGSLACSVAGILRGAQILRVHNVRATVQAVRILKAVQDAGSGG